MGDVLFRGVNRRRGTRLQPGRLWHRAKRLIFILLEQVESEMPGLRLPSFLTAACVAIAGTTLLAPVASFAQSRHAPQTYYSDERARYRTPLEVWISGEGWDEDYLSSHVCINGYRWMTRNVEHSNASAADDSVPVRC